MKTLITLVILLIGSTIYAQTTISGRVTDARNEPIQGANVYLEGTYDGATTNEKGSFIFTTENEPGENPGTNPDGGGNPSSGGPPPSYSNEKNEVDPIENETRSNQTVTASAGGPYHGSVNDTIVFDGSKSTPAENISSYYWVLGDGATAFGQIVKHIYAKPGNYTVTLIVTSTVNQSDTDTTTAFIQQKPATINQTNDSRNIHTINIDKIQGTLIDSDNSGVFDLFVNDNTGITNSVMQTNDGLYLLDTNDDGIWDYAYTVLIDELISYDEIQDESNIYLWIISGIVIILCLAIGIVLFFKYRLDWI